MASETLDQAKTKVTEAVDRLADDLEKISLQIHGNPELCFKEEKASGWLSDFLEKQGARIERGVGGLPTAFRARPRGRLPAPAPPWNWEYRLQDTPCPAAIRKCAARFLQLRRADNHPLETVEKHPRQSYNMCTFGRKTDTRCKHRALSHHT